MKKSLALSTLLLAALAAPAHADTFYIGAGYGESFDRVDDPLIDFDESWKAYGGFQFADNFAVELAYHDFGDASSPPVADFGVDTETDGFSVGALYVHDFGRFHPFAKLGFYRADTEGTITTIAGPTFVDASDNGVMAEIGARFDVTERFAVRAGYEWFDFDDDTFANDGAEGAFNAAVEFRF